MKRILSIFLALALLLAVPALATDVTQAEGSGSTTITATVGSTYVVVIPQTLGITFNVLSTDLTIEATALQLETNKRLKVSATPSGTLKKTGDTSKTIAYAIKNGASAFSDIYFSAIGSKTLTVDITQAAWNAAVAGTYTDTVTFNISIADAA